MRTGAIFLVVMLTTGVGSPSVVAAETQPNADVKPLIRVLATGGTIAGSGQGSRGEYRAGVVPIGDILRAVPGMDDIALVSAEQVANVDSDDMDESLWRKLLERVQSAIADPQVAGVIITHGTATLAETAYF